ncbi:MAG: hypothetical protein JXR83_05760 [Deltaproteobacteria bacterium]|nr:hypothetical protein [Deltaproteobacteria bacterium]
MKENLAQVAVSLDIAGRRSLFVLLSEDGSINRMGTGSPASPDNDLYIGAGQSALFTSFLERVPEEIFAFQGRYEVRERTGAECELAILFGTRANETVGFEFRYGAESEGPPREICDLVRAAVDVTDHWYREQQAMTGDGRQNGAGPQATSQTRNEMPKRR